MLKDFSPLHGKKNLLLTHSGCDVDSLASAAAIHYTLKGKASTAIGVPDRLNTAAAALAKNMGIPVVVGPVLGKYDTITCLDFSEPGMLGRMKQQVLAFKGEKYVIDHHTTRNSTIAPRKNTLVRQSAVSTTEIVHGMLKNQRIPKQAYQCIAAGIITDSSSFLVADHETFSTMAEVLGKAHTTYASVLSLFTTQKDPSEKIACLKAAKRARILRTGNTIVATAEVGAFEADAAAALIRTGADIAFCGYADKGTVHISGRANNNWLRKNRFSLAKHVFEKLGDYYDGTGGGHAGAAGFNGKGNTAAQHLEKCAELVHEHTRKNPSEHMKEYTHD